MQRVTSSSLGVRIYDQANGRNGELVEEVDSPMYIWFKREMLRIDPNLARLPVVNNYADLDQLTTYPGCDSVRDFFYTRLKPLMVQFFDTRLSRKSIYVPAFLYTDDDDDPTMDFVDTLFEDASENSIKLTSTGNAVTLFRATIDSDGEEEEFDDEFKHVLTEFMELLFYLFFVAIRPAYKFTTERVKRARDENSAEAIGAMRAEIHTSKRQRADQMIRAVLLDTDQSLRDIPTEIRLLIANFLPSRDALRLTLRTVARGDAHRSHTQQIVKLLFDRDFQQPLILARARAAPATLAEVDRLTRDIYASARAVYKDARTGPYANELTSWNADLAIRVTVFMFEWIGLGSAVTGGDALHPLREMARQVAADPDKLKEIVTRTIGIDVMDEIELFEQKSASLFFYYWMIAQVMVLPFLAQTRVVDDDDSLEMFLVGDTGIQLKIGSFADMSGVSQIILVRDNTEGESLVGLVKKVNAEIRYAHDRDFMPSERYQFGVDIKTKSMLDEIPGSRVISLFVAHILIAIDPTLTSFIRLAGLNLQSAIGFPAPPSNEKFTHFYTAKDRQPVLANLRVSSLAYGMLARHTYDPSFEMMHMDDPTKVKLAQEPFYVFDMNG